MKYLIASDIHGSYYYLKKLIEAFKREKADKLVLLGDLYYHGPRNPLPEEYNPKLCYELLNEYKDELLVIQGNCDAEVDQMVSTFHLSPTTHINIDGFDVCLAHGHKEGPDNIPNCDILIYGHFHVTRMEKKDGVLLLSPGSISLPKENSPRAYLVYEDKKFSLCDLITGETIDNINL